ncbi:hypothetical protein DM82_4512 [Burkholderia oklahomensis]|uniref:Uncharacterized protein n=1 Tax=Burkholderia oklahomensis TaxID=342113 RepID=A0AAI8FR40_9BURK|nr:hypothetical protein DM82_4512 [Burkholderia oklahomensis]
MEWRGHSASEFSFILSGAADTSAYRRGFACVCVRNAFAVNGRDVSVAAAYRSMRARGSTRRPRQAPQGRGFGAPLSSLRHTACVNASRAAAYR